MTDTQVLPREQRITAAPGSLRALLDLPDIQRRVREVMGARAPQFVASVLSLANASPRLRAAEPMSVLTSALKAAALDLPIEPSLGFAHIVPYESRRTRSVEATFQIGWKGLVQLAQRSGQFRVMNVTEVYAGEIRGLNRFTGALTFGERTSDDITGYLFYFQLTNGFEKYVHMTVDEIKAHAERYSRSWHDPKSAWHTNFDDMARKTVVRAGLSKWAPLSVQMQTALAVDAAAEYSRAAEEAGPELSPEQRDRMKAALWGDENPAGRPPESPEPPSPAADPESDAEPPYESNAAADAEIVAREAQRQAAAAALGGRRR